MTKEDILISVIIPLYNKEITIRKSILSVLNQSYKNLELIIVNDGSTDDSYNIARSINDKRVIIYNVVNGGVSKARNIGINISKGNYLMFLDADDTLKENCISTLVDMISIYPNANIWAGSVEIKKGNKVSCLKTKNGYVENNYKEYFFKKFTLAAGCTLFHRDIIKKIGGYNELIHVYEDADFDMKLMRYASIASSSNVLYTHILDNAELSIKLRKPEDYYAYYIEFNDDQSFYERLLMTKFILNIAYKFRSNRKLDVYKFLINKLKKQLHIVFILKLYAKLFKL